MINENFKAELDRDIEGFNGAAAIEVANINARFGEIKKQMDILVEKKKQFFDDVRQASDNEVSDINSRCSEIMSRGMSYEKLALYAAEGWSLASRTEDACEMLERQMSIKDEGFSLSRELEKLTRRHKVLISSFDEIGQMVTHTADVLEAKCETHRVMKEKAKAPRSTGGKTRYANTEYPEIREAVKAAWGKLANKKHGQRTAFAKGMLITYPAVTSFESFMRWTREWDAENSKSDSTS